MTSVSKLLLFVTSATLALPAFAQPPKPVKFDFPEPLAAKTSSLNPEYLVFGPLDSKVKLPTVIVLHGGGGGGDDVMRLQGTGRKLYEEAKRFGHGPCLVLVPQCIKGGPAKNGIWTAKDLNPLFEEWTARLPIDLDRVYLTGNSMGGYGSWMWGGHNPELFAAILPVVGGIGPGGPKDVTPDLDAWAAKLATVPLWAFVGAKDPVVPAERSERMIKAIQEQGGKQAKLTVYEDEGHGAGRRVWADKAVFEWMFAQKRATAAE